MPALELVSHHLCPYVQRAVIILLEKGIPYQRTDVDLSNKPDWFRQISPLGKVPLLKVGDQVLFESAVICEYLDEITPGSLHPTDSLLKAKHRAWIEFGSSILNTIAGFYTASTAEALEQKQLDLIDKFAWIERHWQGGPYFAGANFSLVDAVYGPIFRYFDGFDTIADFKVFANTPQVRDWRHTLRSHPSVQQAVSEDYPQRLLTFLEQRNSYLSTLIHFQTTHALTR
ncbi:glutathione S-transferase family protein (plasmid) [Kovacikia minuta CCNUW1]|uniref:glutathione S-transferase family protein n=1 Tax=Kovacikia minuta TaxID=2931930 RepID=UPI001CCFC9BC|nr:glutathione S-transferase family protein [Kovacikia minuta]UBF30703.1 glutathione S-transferase family protein [Kovacikia minuta CCNUW1]